MRRTEPTLARAADLLGDDEVDGLEDADVLLEAVERQPERLGELADRGRPARELLEDAPARRIRKGEERPIQCLVMLHRSVHCNAKDDMTSIQLTALPDGGWKEDA